MEDFKKEFVRSGLDQDPSVFDGSRIMLLKNGYASVDSSGARLSLDPSAPNRFEHRNIYSAHPDPDFPDLCDESDDEIPGMAKGCEESDDDLPMFATARYKSAAKTDEQAKLFPELQKEIKERRQASQAQIRDRSFEKFQ